ncbi:MAG: type II secretion system protein [Candidatus Eremiobacterota bacterium]
MRKRAFTLAEVVLGIFLLGIIIVTITSVFIGGLSAAKKSGKKVTNIVLAERMLNRIMLMDYDDIKTGTFDGTINPPTGNFPPTPYPSEIPGSSGGKGGTVYFYKVTVTEVAGTSSKLKSIIVTVTSQGAGSEGITRTTLETLKSQ